MNPKVQNKEEKDLFEQFQAKETTIRKKTRLILPSLKKSVTVSYENAIFLAIGFVMSCVIFFSLGVEKGRRDINRIETVRLAMERLRVEPMKEPAKEPVREPIKELHKQDTIKSQPQSRYVIHLVAFKNKEPAEEEVSKLKKQGYGANMKKSGEYYQVYIGGFEQQKDAERLVKKLKEKYGDCYIKKSNQ